MSAAEAKTYIIGVGSDGLAGLTVRARDLLLSADLLVGSERDLQPLRAPPFVVERGAFQDVTRHEALESIEPADRLKFTAPHQLVPMRPVLEIDLLPSGVSSRRDSEKVRHDSAARPAA